MKHPARHWLVFLFGLILFGCRKSDSGPNNPPNNNNDNNNDTATTVHADTLSNHLLFLTATKVGGNAPPAPAASGIIKISVKDTLYLTDELPRAIKFLHKDTLKNVAGVSIQIIGKTASSFYYDVPEIQNMKDNDTVSVIMIGIEPDGLKKPQTAEVKMVPYDENKQPITQIIRPVKIIENKVNDPSGSGCGLGLPPGERWVWELSLVQGDAGSNDLAFYNEPNKVHSAQGQDIEGSCCNGNSKWPEFCVGELSHNRTLHFATYYKINFENFRFFSNGSFSRDTEEDAPVPLPAESDFCGGGAGVVKASLKPTLYDGTWSITASRLPANYLWKEDTLELELRTTSQFPDQGGYGNPGGVIHQLDCTIGALVLVQLDREGRGRHLFKFYSAVKQDEFPWSD